MGRRKIEIQPIIHERNRSVTFLKRKNGLFKKAYELGVLCSVDVAVIIFEERPGHHLKLYQYCSTDIHDIVQRHVRYDGEKDTKGPPDFSGNTSRLDDAVEGDDDDVDDDEDPRARSKRGGDGKLKPVTTDLADYNLHHVSIPPPPSMHVPGMPSGGGSSSHPVSSARDSSHHSSSASYKKPRLAPTLDTHSRSSSDDTINPSSGGGYPYSHAPYRQQQHQQHSSNQYSPLFPPSSQNSQTPSFIPPTFDYPPSSASSRGPPPPPSTRALTTPAFSSRSYDNGLYNIMRPGTTTHTQGGQTHGSTHHGAQSHHHHSHQGQGPQSGGGDLLSLFDNDAGRHTQGQGNAGFGEFDWPVHAQGQGGSASSVPNQGPPSSSSSGGDNHWLDFLSGNGPNSGGGASTNSGSGGPASAGSAGGARDSGPGSGMSWERGGERNELPELGALGRGSLLTSPLVGRGSGVGTPGGRGRMMSPHGHGHGGHGHASSVGDEESVSPQSGGGRVNGRQGMEDVKMEKSSLVMKGEVGG